MKVFLTGATGMIGRTLCPELVKRNFQVCCGVRRQDSIPAEWGAASGIYPMGDLDGGTDFSRCLAGVDIVIHLAGLAHVAGHSPEAFSNVNFHGTRNLARQAARFGVKRFIFLSSATVAGPATAGPVGEQDAPRPATPYARSKAMAEQALGQIERETGMEVVILRPPLVYGPGVKANFLKLIRAAASGIPLPLAEIRNRRSFIGIDNLNHAILSCILHPAAAGQTFFVSDGCDLSVSRLMDSIRGAMGQPARMFYCPEWFFKGVLTLMGKQGIYERIWGSLTVDSSKIRRRLGWAPKVSVDAGIQKTVDWYLKQKQWPDR